MVLLIQQNSIFEGYGGVEYYLDDLAQTIHQLKPGSIQVLSPLRRQTALVDRPYPAHLISYGPSRFRKIQNRIPWKLFLKARALIQKQRPDFILCGHIALAPLCLLLSQLYNCPWGAIAYGIDIWGRRPIQDYYSLRKASFLIAISSFTKAKLRERKFKRPIFLLHPTLTTDAAEAPFLAPKKDGFQLLTISRLSAAERYKGQDLVLKTLHRMISKGTAPKGLLYTIVGEGDDKPRLQKMVDELGLSQNVFFRAAVKERAELSKIYQSSHVFVMPASFEENTPTPKGEGFGIVFAESMAYGRPCISTDLGGQIDIIDSNINGVLIRDPSIESLEAAILQVADNLEQYCQAAYQKAHECFHPRDFSSHVLSLLKEISKVIQPCRMDWNDPLLPMPRTLST